jgi:outer membrane protein assembly factor BamB
MQNKLKTTATAAIITILLTLSMVTFASAQLSHIGTTDPNTPGYPDLGPLPPGVTPDYTFTQVPYLSFRPNPIGVGQSLLVNVWCSPGTYHAFPMVDYEVDIIKPDGTTETVGPFNSYVGDATGWFEYVPDQVGTWQFKFHQPGTYIPAGQYWDQPGSETGGFIASGKYYDLYASIYYTAGETEWQNLTVQADLVSSWPYSVLPNDYWTRPVNVMWRDWGQFIGDYPFNSLYYFANGRVLYPSNYKFTAYVTAPNTGHVLRKVTYPGTLSGMVGGYTWDYSLASNPGGPDIIFAGRCYDSITTNMPDGTVTNQYTCYNLQTGEIYWQRNLSPYPNPQYIEYSPPTASTTIGDVADRGWSINFIAISGGRLYRYNPATGAPSGNYSLSPISSATYYMPGYALSVQDLGSAAENATGGRYRLINWTTFGSSNNFASRIVSNISWPQGGFGAFGAPGVYGPSIRGGGGAADFEYGLCATVGWNTPPGPQWGIGSAIVVTDQKTGQVLWTYQTNNTITENIQSTSSVIWYKGKLAFNVHGRSWVCFDGRTGQKLWTSEKTSYPWGSWWPYNVATYPFNSTSAAIITGTYEGVYAINWADGKILWHYTDENAVPFEGPYTDAQGKAATPFFTGVTMADGKIYTYNGEHTQSQPFSRDWKIHCINATTGEGIWKMLNPMTPGAMADGYLTASNPYDGYLYVFGKGKSATTVTASPKTIAEGAEVLIEGTVMDMSPGQPNTPCVSKDSMETQMEYLHLQMPIDGLWHNESIIGVPVSLTALDSDYNAVDIGMATTNGYGGNFGVAWTPTKEGTYTIYASFAGDDSYGSSSAYTTIHVGPAPEPIEIPPATEPVDNTMLLYGILVAVVIAIVLALIAIVAIFRKR